MIVSLSNYEYGKANLKAPFEIPQKCLYSLSGLDEYQRMMNRD